MRQGVLTVPIPLRRNNGTLDGGGGEYKTYNLSPFAVNLSGTNSFEYQSGDVSGFKAGVDIDNGNVRRTTIEHSQ